MSPDLKDGENSFKSSPENVLRNRKLNGQRNASDQTGSLGAGDSPAAELSSKSNKVNKDKSRLVDQDDSLDSPFSFQIRINLPVCFLFGIAFLMRFWLIDYPKSIV